METIVKKPLFLVGSTLIGGATILALRKKKPVNPPMKELPPITSADTALLHAPYLQLHHELQAILEDMGRFYRMDPQIYVDIVMFCDTLCKIWADVQDYSNPLRLGDQARALNAKLNATAAVYCLREKCRNNASMLHVITEQLRDLNAKLSDVCHNIDMVLKGRVLEAQF